MARRFLVPIELPGDAGASLYAVPKQQLDTQIATRAAASHVHSGTDITTGTISGDRLPNVFHPPINITYAASLTVDPTQGTNFKITATGALALAVSTTGALDGQMIMIDVLASGAARTVTLNAAILLTTGLTSANTITSAKVGFFGVRYTALLSAWVLLSQTQSL